MKLILRSIEATNTKMRRLAYVTAIVNMLDKRGMGERTMCEKLVQWDQRQDIGAYWVQTGQASSNYAAKRYLQFATALGVVSARSGHFRNTRIGLVIRELTKSKTGDSAHLPFSLTIQEKLAYLYLLVEKDTDFLFTIMDAIHDHESISLSELQQSFKQLLLDRIKSKFKMATAARHKQTLLDRREEVLVWEKPARYAEHLVAPRVNWLLDLGLLSPIEFTRHKYLFTEHGDNFYTSVPKYSTLAFSDVSDQWLQKGFWIENSEEITGQDLMDWESENPSMVQTLSKALAHSFQDFQYTPIPKVSLSQILFYLSIYLITEFDTIICPADVLSWLQTSPVWQTRRYQVRLSARENESFLIATSVS